MPEQSFLVEDEEVSRKFTYLTQLYEAMEAEAEDGIYKGKIVDTFATLSISMSYYTELFNVLKELGCIELIDRGVRGRPTRYRLHVAPTIVAYERSYAARDKDLTGADRPARVPITELDQRIMNIERMLSGVDIKQVLADYEKRIARLEQQKGGSK
jgi:hypothetical protein